MDFKSIRKQRLTSIAEGKIRVGPQTVHFDLANGCNTNCTTCWDHSPLLSHPRTTDWKRKQVSLTDFLPLADDIASMDSVEAVILSGMGDPFVNQDIYSIIRVCKHYGWHVTTLTNALLADPARILEFDVDMMLISVNGVSEDSYTAFHPNLTARDFAKLCRLLEWFATAGKRFKHVQVINRDTADEVVEMIHFAARYKAQHITYKLASLGHGTERCAMTELQRERLLSDLIPRARSEAQTLGILTNLDVFEAQVRTGGLAAAPMADIGCFMGWTYARVTVDGTILFCCSTEVEVGHLSRGTFSEQWYGPQWNAVRQQLMAGQYFSSCSQCGKLNQNVKIGKKVKEKFGELVYLQRTGQTHKAQGSGLKVEG